MSEKSIETGLKAGVKSTEFYLSLAAVLLGVVISTGVVDIDSGAGIWDKFAGIACTLLAAFGYTVSRAKVKAAAEENK
tara:strand:- start:83 stop:316 length:234 start_codon:yes stop_codon:yes gene_type:complete